MALTRIVIAGCGPGARSCVTGEVLDAVACAETLVGPARLLALFPEVSAERIESAGDARAVCTALESRVERNCVVLVTGDPGVCSIARRVVQHFGPARCRVLPGVSALQVACARLGVEWHGARMVSAHAELPTIPFECFKQERVITVLGGAARAQAWVADLLDHLGAEWTLWTAENLTLDDERIRALRPVELRRAKLSSLTVFVLQRSETH